MNNRIKELIEQCTIDIESFDAERFAELILKECIGLMDRQNKYYADTGTYESREYYERCRAKEEAFDEASDSIKYHFGI